jgi:hypothetical protein
MNDSRDFHLPRELEEIGAHLRENRHESSALELDELKTRAMSQASRASRSRPPARFRLVTSFLVLGLLTTGASAGVVAGGSGSSGGSSPTASASQYEQVVLGERILPGSARLVGPTGCVAKAFNARVTGQNIASVVFVLDGKKIKTLTKPNAGTRFQVRINPAKFKIGVHRLRATIKFLAATKKAPQTLRLSFQRCAKKLAAPRFTG